MEFIVRLLVCLKLSLSDKDFMIGLVIGNLKVLRNLDDNSVNEIKEEYITRFNKSSIELGIMASRWFQLTNQLGCNELINLLNSKYPNEEAHKSAVTNATYILTAMLTKYCTNSKQASLIGSIQKVLSVNPSCKLSCTI